jgi:ATP/maltotriose-dependent transcriptional regulator MalT
MVSYAADTTMEISDHLAAARAAFERHRWGPAREGFLAARAQQELSAEDMAALADAAWWEGAIDESISAMEEAYRLYVHGDTPAPRPAAMVCLDLAFSWFLRGEPALGSGWLSRAQRLLDDEPPCVEHAYLQSLAVEGAMAEGDYGAARELAQSVAGVARQQRDETLEALAMVSDGVAAIKQGDVKEGVAVLDEAMLPVVAGRVRPAFAGNIYCTLMSICHELGDLRRAQQWTDATARWCEGFDSAVMFLGVCRMHRAQLLQVKGEWDRAEAEIALVCEELERMNIVAVGMAYYELGEVRRCRGDLAGAEAAYADAHSNGLDPHPGLALVWVAQGKAGLALESLAAAAASTVDPLAKARLWAALVDAAIAAGNHDAACAAADELDAAATAYASAGLVAAARHARGQALLATGDAAGAARSRAAARDEWQALGAPYRVAPARGARAHALAQQGDDEAAERESAAAEATFAALGVTAQGSGLTGRGAANRPGGLTPREVEVLGQVARGLSNREVADVLVLSEKTVARHLANVFTKLGVSSRTAAAAFAHEQGLVPPAST